MAGNVELITTGLYGITRHPIYTYTLAAFLFSVVMSLDRLVLCLGVALYLFKAVPIEEKKLHVIFGKPYDDYKLVVPAVVPNLFQCTRLGKKNN